LQQKHDTGSTQEDSGQNPSGGVTAEGGEARSWGGVTEDEKILDSLNRRGEGDFIREEGHRQAIGVGESRFPHIPHWTPGNKSEMEDLELLLSSERKGFESGMYQVD